MRNRIRFVGVVAACAAVVGLLSGCSGGLTPRPALTDGTHAATPRATPSSPSTPHPASTPTSAASSSANATQGCPANDQAVPAGASTAAIEDVDGDGKPDTEFYSEVGRFSYGIHTASGATVFLPDDLAGPGKHSGWSARLDGPAIVATVLDDSRTATLHVFIDCSFRTPTGANGQPYRFELNGFGDRGTGVACTNENGGILIVGALAQRRSNGRYDIQWTQIQISPDGATATNGMSETRYANLSASDPLVRKAMGSFCNDVPKVATSGR